MSPIWMRRYQTWIDAGFDNWEALRFCFIGPADWNWFDRAGWQSPYSYPWEEV